MVTDPLRVVVFAHSRLLAQALAEALDAEAGFDVVGGTEAEADVLAVDADVLVMSLPAAQGNSTLALVRAALVHHRDLAVVMVADPGPASLTREALELGVRGWVDSDEPLARLIATVHAVGSHGVCIPVAVLTAALAAENGTPRVGAPNPLLLRLTPRQSEVLRCLVEGRSRAQTGAALEMSNNTVRTHVGAILRRLQVHSTLAAVAVAREAELLGRSAETATTANGVAGLGR